MKFNRNHLTWALIGLAALAVGFAAFGCPIIPPDALAGIGLIPIAAGATIGDVVEAFENYEKRADAARKAHDLKLDGIENEVRQLAIQAGRPKFGGAGDGNNGEIKQLRLQNGQLLPLLNSEQKAARLYTPDQSDDFDLGEYARGCVVGSRKAASGPALVPSHVGAQVIDMVRAQATLVRAGAGTIMIDGPTALARISSGPTVYQHTEAATDITESDVVAAAVTLNPKTLAALVPLTVELVQDSPNLDAVLRTALAGAFAAKLDALGIAKLLADTDIPDSAAGQDPAVWAKVLEAVGSALALNQDMPTSHISAPADFIARASQLASSAGSWLGKPPALALMSEYFTTNLTAGTALFGRFSEAFAFAVRADLSVEVVRHAKATSGSHLLVGHMRADGIVLQPAKLFRQLKTV